MIEFDWYFNFSISNINLRFGYYQGKIKLYYRMDQGK